MPPATAVALALAGGIVHGACFSPLGIWPLAFIAITPLTVASYGRRPRTAVALGWLAGTVTALFALVPWMAIATRAYFQQGLAGGVLFASMIGQVYVALPAAAFAMATARVSRLRTSWLRVLAIGAVWTATELARTRTAMGSPWDLLGHALYAQPLWIQSAELGGSFAVSWVLAVVGAAVADVAVHGVRRAQSGLTAAVIVLVATAGYGAMRLSVIDDAAGPQLRLGLVQGAVPNAWRGDPALASAAFDAFTNTSEPVLAARPDLLVWSENAVSFLLAPNGRFMSDLATLLAPTGTPLLLGAPRFAQTEPGRVRFFNSVYLVDAAGQTIDVYDKRRLVPFAEYAPVGRIPGLSWRFDAPGDYSPGSRATVFTTPQHFGVLICFEAIYPDLAADLVRAGARVILNLSNDAWFGNHAGLEQHFAMSAFRAVETRRAVARTTNIGVTGVIGASGRIVDRFPPNVRDAWMVSVPLRDDVTIYTRFGDAFAWMMTAAAVLALLAADRR